MHQSICYIAANRWTVSVAWGFVVTMARASCCAREMQMPARTFMNWYWPADYKARAFNTNPLAHNQCERPALYYLASAWRTVVRVIVFEKPNPELWDLVILALPILCARRLLDE